VTLVRGQLTCFELSLLIASSSFSPSRRRSPISFPVRSRRLRSSESKRAAYWELPPTIQRVLIKRAVVHREHGSKVIGEVTLDQAYGGARGVKCLVWEVGPESLFPSPSVSVII
jgi:hypothetical protein